MPIFEYKALTEKGRPKRGIIDADTAREARDKLRVERLHVTDMRRLEERAARRARAGKTGFEIRMPQLERRVRTRDLAVLTRQLAVLLSSGIHLSEALTALIEQATDRRLERILRDVREKITSGANLGEALSKHPTHFSDLYVNMVRAGEASGELDRVLVRLADYLQKQASLRGKIVAALTYPFVMIFVGTAVVVFLMSYVVPKIVKVLKEQKGQALPLTTEILIKVSYVFQHYWWFILIAALGVVVAYRLFVATERGRYAVDSHKLRVPLFGTLLRKAAISRFAVSLSTLLKSGLPALESLKIVARVVNNVHVAEIIEKIADRIVEGTDIATPVKHSKVFPPIIGYMIAIGEQTGELETILDRINEAYEEEVDLAIQRMTALMEPVVIVALAVIVGFIILGVLLPLIQLSSM